MKKLIKNCFLFSLLGITTYLKAEINITSSPYNASPSAADNTAAIQAAINAANATGDAIFIPNGIYMTGPLVVINKKNLVIYSNGGTLKLLSTATNLLFDAKYYSNSTTYPQTFISSQFRLDFYTRGNTATTNPTCSTATVQYLQSLLWVYKDCDNFKCNGLNFDGNGTVITAKTYANDYTNPQDPLKPIISSVPDITGSALLLVNAPNATIQDVKVTNTRMRGIAVASSSQLFNIAGPSIKGCDVSYTSGEGISVYFALEPIIKDCKVSNIGNYSEESSYIKINSVGTNIVINTNFTHNKDERIGVYKKIKSTMVSWSPLRTDMSYEFIGSMKKDNFGSITHINNVTSFPLWNKTLYGGKSDLVTTFTNESSNYDFYLLSNKITSTSLDISNGILTNNCLNSKISNCSVKIVGGMGIAILNDLGNNGGALISNCFVKSSGNEGIALDGCRSGLITSCVTESNGILSDAPDLHIANDSPGITEPYGNSIIGCNSRNAITTAPINAGLGMVNSSTSGRSYISSNHVFRNSTFNWDNNSVGIQGVGPKTTISSNYVEGFDCGINIIKYGSQFLEGNTIQNNTLIGNNVTSSWGIKCINSAWTNINYNTIQQFDVGIYVTTADAYKITNNHINYCHKALTDDVVSRNPYSLFAFNTILTDNANIYGGFTPALVNGNYVVTVPSF